MATEGLNLPIAGTQGNPPSPKFQRPSFDQGKRFMPVAEGAPSLKATNSNYGKTPPPPAPPLRGSVVSNVSVYKPVSVRSPAMFPEELSGPHGDSERRWSADQHPGVMN